MQTPPLINEVMWVLYGLLDILFGKYVMISKYACKRLHELLTSGQTQTRISMGEHATIPTLISWVFKWYVKKFLHLEEGCSVASKLQLCLGYYAHASCWQTKDLAFYFTVHWKFLISDIQQATGRSVASLSQCQIGDSRSSSSAARHLSLQSRHCLRD